MSNAEPANPRQFSEARLRVLDRAVGRAACIALVSVLMLLLAPRMAEAHSGVQSYVYLDVTDEGLGGRVEMPFGDLREVLGFQLNGSEDEALAELIGRGERLDTYVRDHFAIGDSSARWPYEITLISLLEGEGGYAVVHFLVDVPFEEVPRLLEVDFDPFFDQIDERTAFVLIGNDWKAGIIENGEDILLGFDPETRTREIDLGSASQWNNFVASIGQGIGHIETGPDHILFIAVLLLPAVLVFRQGWQPSASFRASIWRILKIVSMFTLAHSITFVLAGIDLIPLPPSRLVEAVIALSIAISALHNLRPVVLNREWLLAFVFGLFHGMGFAGFVQGLDLNRETKLVSLLGRNVGIEIGQAVVVLLVFPALFLLRRTRWYRPIFVVGSVGLAVIASAWMIERLFEVDLRIGGVVDPFLVWPRNISGIVVITAAAAGIYATERRAGRLLSTPDDGPALEDDNELVAAG